MKNKKLQKIKRRQNRQNKKCARQDKKHIVKIVPIGGTSVQNQGIPLNRRLYTGASYYVGYIEYEKEDSGNRRDVGMYVVNTHDGKYSFIHINEMSTVKEKVMPMDNLTECSRLISTMKKELKYEKGGRWEPVVINGIFEDEDKGYDGAGFSYFELSEEELRFPENIKEGGERECKLMIRDGTLPKDHELSLRPQVEDSMIPATPSERSDLKIEGYELYDVPPALRNSAVGDVCLGFIVTSEKDKHRRLFGIKITEDGLCEVCDTDDIIADATFLDNIREWKKHIPCVWSALSKYKKPEYDVVMVVISEKLICESTEQDVGISVSSIKYEDYQYLISD